MVVIKTDLRELCYSLQAQFNFNGKLIKTADTLHENLHSLPQSSRTEQAGNVFSTSVAEELQAQFSHVFSTSFALSITLLETREFIICCHKYGTLVLILIEFAALCLGNIIKSQ